MGWEKIGHFVAFHLKSLFQSYESYSCHLLIFLCHMQFFLTRPISNDCFFDCLVLLLVLLWSFTVC